MSDIVLMLGPVVFRDFEIPSGIGFGGAQRIAVHRLPGGVRILDALGRDDSEISFSGVFSGKEATARARALDELRTAGSALPLTWDAFYFTVVIAGFHANYRNGAWIPYRIVCTVLRDETSALVQSSLSVATTILADINSAMDQTTAIGLDMSALTSSINGDGAMQRGTVAYATARRNIADVLVNIDGYIGAAGMAVSSNNPFNASTCQESALGLDLAVRCAGDLCNLVTARSYLNRAARNHANESS